MKQPFHPKVSDPVFIKGINKKGLLKKSRLKTDATRLHTLVAKQISALLHGLILLNSKNGNQIKCVLQLVDSLIALNRL